jgi:hypothetical protein
MSELGEETFPPPTHQHCAKCNRVLEASAFRRYLTPAEAKARGYTGNRRVLIETAHCKDCRPRRRTKPEAFTTAELKKKLKRGEIAAPIVKALEKTRTATARARMRSAVVARWDKAKLSQYQALMKEIKAEIIAVTQQRKHARGRAASAPMAQSVEVYADTYLAILRRLRADLTLAGRRLAFKVEHERWQEYLTHQEKDAIAAAWGRINPNKSASMRPPGAFATDRLTRPVVPMVYVKDAEEPEPTPPTNPEESTRPETDWDAM